MSDRKAERLINLTLALLATKRYLKKSEILRSVSGYEGSEEAQERMFERDKDDLRSLGIEIQVGDLDAFFEDEPGYRIPQSSYELQVPDLTSRELAIISLASSLWNGSILSQDAQAGLRKLQSLGVPAGLDLDYLLKYRYENPTQVVEILSDAILNRIEISFKYGLGELRDRHIEPYRILFWNGFWYLVGMDIDREAIRIFKLSRITSDIVASKKRGSFEIPENFDVSTYLPQDELTPQFKAVLKIAKDCAHLLRQRGLLIREESDWDIFEVIYEDEKRFLRELLWHEDKVVVIEPVELRNAIISLLSGVMA